MWHPGALELTKVEQVVFDDQAQRLTNAVATELSELRRSKEVSYVELEERTGISKRKLIRLLKGETPIDVADLYRLCFVLVADPASVVRNAEKRAQE